MFWGQAQRRRFKPQTKGNRKVESWQAAAGEARVKTLQDLRSQTGKLATEGWVASAER